jgi:predicted metal-dependent hydrolase
MAKEITLYPLLRQRYDFKAKQDTAFIKELLLTFGHMIRVNSKDKTLTSEKLERLLSKFIESQVEQRVKQKEDAF